MSTLSHERAKTLTAGFAGKRIVVLGDLMLDEFIWGRVRRISPEAPVPVVEVDRQTLALGGAGNVVSNLVSLGAVPHPSECLAMTVTRTGCAARLTSLPLILMRSSPIPPGRPLSRPESSLTISK